MKTSNNLVGTAGEYYVCGEICRRGYLALITPKNNPLFDIVASDPEGIRSISIQVKTRSIQNEQGWKLGKDVTMKRSNPNLFVVLVNLQEQGLPDFYIYEFDILAERVETNYLNYLATPKRDGTRRKDVGFRWHDVSYFTDDDRGRLNNWRPIIDALKGV
ncbi:MAG: aspartate-ammonia lyase [Deltaproteobacteria bacterium]|nr:aspartate-ammonia lyase [Deltaproteobacteria bacterium]